METKKKVSTKKYILSLVLTAISFGIYLKSDGQTYGVIYTITFFMLAVTAILNKETMIDYRDT